MEIVIRDAVAEDMPAVLNLIRELARFEGCEEEVRISEEQLIGDGFGEEAFFRCFLACAEDEILGFCLSWYRYSTWRGRLLYVEDLYVRELYRKQGIGKMLLDAKIELARNQGLSHVHLQVLDWNQPAIELYKKYGAAFDQSWVNVLIPLQSEA